MPSRRSVLATVGSALVVSAGCTADDGPGTRTGDEPESPQAEPTAVTPTDVDRVDDFYVENLHGERHTVHVTVSAGNDDPVIDGRYRLPARTGIHIPDVGEEGNSYDVVVSLGDGRRLDETWDVRDCPNAYEGNRDASVRVTAEGELRLVENGCDVITVGLDVSTGKPEEYRVTPTESSE